MRLKTKIEQQRRDFTADYECESCGNVHRGTGYDDVYFHQSVIPNMTCTECGEKSPVDAGTTTPDVPAGLVL